MASANGRDGLATFEEQGYAVVSEALGRRARARLEAAVDAVYEEERRAGRLAADGSLHLLDVFARDRRFLELLDLGTTFGLVCDLLGWNIYAYHSHLDVHPPTRDPEPVWRWHQDGGRQNVELESPIRPRLSIKVGYFLTDVEDAEDGAFTVIPGSHRESRLARPEAGDPDGAEAIPVAAGSAVVFDRRIWHTRGDNTGGRVRKAVFVAYTYRWIRPRGEPVPEAVGRGVSPLRRQLLGLGSSGLGFWLPGEDDVPLRAALES
jgi:ectoine hydroxylase-related dioxygenase (phytanoyl-CoA dioxygenase family)